MASAPCSSPSLAAAAGAIARAPRSAAVPGGKKLTCLCSPTNHPGSFRCSRHRNGGPAAASGGGDAGRVRAAAKGRCVRALLLQRISCPADRDRQRQQRRRSGEFQPRPSRLRLMNM